MRPTRAFCDHLNYDTLFKSSLICRLTPPFPTQGPDAAQFTVTPVFERARFDGPLAWSGPVPVRVKTALDRSGIALDEVLPLSRTANGRNREAKVPA